MNVSLEAPTKPLDKLAAVSDIPPLQNEPKEMSYFNTKSEVCDVSTYDRVFHQVEGFDMKQRYKNRQNCKGRGLNINQEERSRPVPVLSSSEYGRHFNPTLNRTVRRYERLSTIKSEFYMTSGIIWNVEEGYGSVAPI
ncbi:cilia- and flagella-associated protein 90 [Anableps anableps]